MWQPATSADESDLPSEVTAPLILRRQEADVRSSRGQNNAVSPFPAGIARGDPPGEFGVHAMDGDGASLCGALGEDALVQIDDLRWSDIARDHRCRGCQIFMTGFGLEHH